jgi:hypothetical protein
MKKLVLIFGGAILVVFLVIWCTVGAIANPVSDNQTDNTTLNTTVSSHVPILGDANGDHAVNVADITYVERVTLGLDPPTSGCYANPRGSEIDMGQVVWIERQILGLEPIYGDADGNDIVDQRDVTYVEDVILGLKPATQGCDANRDGKISVSDIVTIENMISK